MNFFLLIIICNTIHFFPYEQNTPEQKAFEHFFNKIFFDEGLDDKIHKISFNGSTEDKYCSFGIYSPCFKGKKIMESLYSSNQGKNQLNKVSISIDNLDNSILFKKRKTKYTLNISRALKISDKYYVQIEVAYKNSYVDAYYIELNEDYELGKWCKTGIIY